MKKAMEKWSGGTCAEFGEANDPAYRLALRGVEQPLDEEFLELAQRILAPLLGALVDDRLG